MKLGVPREYFFEHMEPAVKRLVEDGIGQLEKLGMEVREVRFPHVKYTAGTFIGIVVAESAANHDEWLNERAAELGIDVRNFPPRWAICCWPRTTSAANPDPDFDSSGFSRCLPQCRRNRHSNRGRDRQAAQGPSDLTINVQYPGRLQRRRDMGRTAGSRCR